MNPHYERVAERAEHRCEYCRAPEAIFNLPFEVEHIVPVSRGGIDDEANLALACRACNLYKSDHLTGRDELADAAVTLFHPRRETWTQHFRLDPESGTVQGLTPTGRATIACLQMNAPLQVAARRTWIRLGLFP